MRISTALLLSVAILGSAAEPEAIPPPAEPAGDAPAAAPAESRTFAGQYSWSQSGGEKGGQRGPVSCVASPDENGAWRFAYTSTYQGKTYRYAGILTPSEADPAVLVGTAVGSDKGGQATYHVQGALSEQGGFRGRAYLQQRKDGTYTGQIAVFTMAAERAAKDRSSRKRAD